MAHVREFAGVVYTFNEDGQQIDAFGALIGGPSEQQLAGSGQPETPFTFPPDPTPPPPIVPPPQPTSGLYTFAVTNNMLQPAGGLTVTISRDVGSGTTRTTDNNGLASFAVPIGVTLDWTITGGAYQPASGTAFIGAAGRTEAVVMFPIGPPPPIPIGPQPAHLRLTVHDATTGHVLPAVDVDVSDGAGFALGGSTDATGFVDLLVPLGAVRVALHAAGYVDTALTVTVAASMDLALTLGPIPPSPSPSPTPGPTPGPTPSPTPAPTPPPGGGGPINDSGARPPGFAVPRVQFDTVAGVRSIATPSLKLLEVPTFGFSPASLIGTIISGIAALFGGGGSGSDISKISNRLDRIGDFVLSLAQTIETATARSTHVDTQGGNLFDRIVGSVLGPIINALAALIRGGSGDLGKLFGPITDGLKKLLDTVRHLYNTWLKPILRAIDITRQILRVLNALGLEFAGKLDAQLGRIEGKLTRPMLLLQSKINELRNEVNKIVTLNGALQRVTLLKSLTTHKACVQRAVLNSWIADPSTVPATLPPPAAASTVNELVDDYGTFVKSGTSVDLDDYDAWQTSFRGELAGDG